MAILKQKKLSKTFLFSFGILFFAGLLFSIPQKAVAANYSAGWYEDIGLENNPSCQVGNWEAYIEIKDASGNPLQADSLTVLATWYEDPNSLGTSIYAQTVYDVSSFSSGCVIDSVRDSNGDLVPDYGIVVLTLTAEEDGYQTMVSANVTKGGGRNLSRVKWSRTLYLAPLSYEEPNLAYVFPVDNQWVSTTDLRMKMFIRKRPVSNNITKVKIEAINISTGDKFYSEITPNINEGEITFPSINLSQGSFLWRIVSMEDDKGFFYNEASFDLFRFDTIPPEFVNQWGRGWWSYNATLGSYTDGDVEVKTRDDDNDDDYILAVSGIKKVDIYIFDDSVGDFVLEKTFDYPTPEALHYSHFDFPPNKYGVGTHQFYGIVEDYAGNISRSPNKSFTIPELTAPILDVWAYIGENVQEGVNIARVSGPSGVGDATSYTYIHTPSTDQLSAEIQAPDTYSGKNFSFWVWQQDLPNGKVGDICPGSASYQDKNCGEFTINPGARRSAKAYFGTSIFRFSRSIDWGTGGSIGMDTREQYRIEQDINTPLVQIQGSPTGLTKNDFNSWFPYIKIIAGNFNNVIFEAQDSADGVLQFKNWYGGWYSCDNNPVAGNRQCQFNIAGNVRQFIPVYSLQRTVAVRSYVDNQLAPGIYITQISGPSGIADRSTNYEFKSTLPIVQLDSVLQAPLVYNVSGQEKKFAYWVGCDGLYGEQGRNCILNETGWYDAISRTVRAYYGTPPEGPVCECGTLECGQCAVNNPPQYCNSGGVLVNDCRGPDVISGSADDCGCPSGLTCQGDGSCILSNSFPTARNLLEYSDYCNPGNGIGSINLSWNYSDDDGDGQSAYRLQIDDDSSLDVDPLIDCEISNNNSDVTVQLVSSSPNYNCSAEALQIQYGKDYWWRVMVQDSRGAWSTGWFYPDEESFNVKAHGGPSPDFDILQVRVGFSRDVQFCSMRGANPDCAENLVEYYGNYPTWNWNFGDSSSGSNNTSNIENPSHIYWTPGIYAISLTVGDEVDSCTIKKAVIVGAPDPIWKEIIPVSRIQNFIAGIIGIIKEIF